MNIATKIFLWGVGIVFTGAVGFTVWLLWACSNSYCGGPL